MLRLLGVLLDCFLSPLDITPFLSCVWLPVRIILIFEFEVVQILQHPLPIEVNLLLALLISQASVKRLTIQLQVVQRNLKRRNDFVRLVYTWCWSQQGDVWDVEVEFHYLVLIHFKVVGQVVVLPCKSVFVDVFEKLVLLAIFEFKHAAELHERSYVFDDFFVLLDLLINRHDLHFVCGWVRRSSTTCSRTFITAAGSSDCCWTRLCILRRQLLILLIQYLFLFLR